jgi:hypothetical protein
MVGDGEAAPVDRDEVEAWLRRQLLEVVRQKSARWGIDFASDPIERIASVVLAEEGLTPSDLELEPPPPPHLLFNSHLSVGVSDSTAVGGAQSFSTSSSTTTPSSTSSSASTTTSSSSSTTTPSSSSGYDHSSVCDVQRTGSKRPQR